MTKSTWNYGWAVVLAGVLMAGMAVPPQVHASEESTADEADDLPERSSKVKFPIVCGWVGKIEVVSPGVTPKNLSKKTILFQSAELRTFETGQLCLDLSPTDRIVISKNSTVVIPAIGVETGEVSEIQLDRGEMRIIQHYKDPPSSRLVSSKIYRQRVLIGDFIFRFNPESGEGGVLSLDGNMNFSALENEVVTPVTPGELVTFRAEMKGKEIQYDQLLQGRKVVRGELEAKQTLKPKDLDKVRASFSAFDMSLMRKKALAIIRQEKKPIKNVKSICVKPEAEFNQCAFICQGNPKKAKKCRLELAGVKCIRKRCNAEGFWTDEYEMPRGQSTCKAKTFVGPCNH